MTVHCVHPGVVRTNFGTNMRTADTEDPDLARKLFARAALTSPEKAARVILRGTEKNRARILIGPDGRAMAAMPRLLGISSALWAVISDILIITRLPAAKAVAAGRTTD